MTKASRIICAFIAIFLLLTYIPAFAEEKTYTVNYNTTSATVKVGETISLIATPKFPSGATDIKYQWFVATTTKLSEAIAIDGATSSLYKPNTKVAGDYFYFCEVKAKIDGQEVTTLNYNKMTVIALTVRQAVTIVPVGSDNVAIFKPSEVVFFTVEIENAKNASVSWYTYENGSTGKLLALGETMAVKGITADLLGVPQYFACVAVNSNNEADIHIFTCTLLDESMKGTVLEPTKQPDAPREEEEERAEEDIIPEEEKDEYIFPFEDVKENDWFFADVKSAHKNGLINGKAETLYCPDDNMTYAEAVKLACALHQLDKDGKVTIPNGSTFWYSTYMDYALINGIIEEDLSNKANEPITRKEYVYIFYKALPEEKFTEINTISAGAIPDVESGKYYHRIYTFYRAGILTGSDEKGTFSPDSNIRRSEVAAILTRMYDSSARKTIALK